jgi:hypothetical protein
MAGNLQRQLAEVQNNMLTAESAQASQEIVSSDNSWTVRVMNGMLQQQDVTGQWVDVAPIEELQQQSLRIMPLHLLHLHSSLQPIMTIRMIMVDRIIIILPITGHLCELM